MPKRSLQDARLIALFLLGCLALTYPLLSLFSRSGTIFGIPLLYVYLYGAWATLIVLAGLATRR
ncbi:MAG: hypothetical protein H6R10_1659 [Rhodocyclaceae bacterium]|nr:hypothetical protein [Rhodocyclaceae bacterium]